MSISKWRVGYIEGGVVKYQNIWWMGQPSEREAATLIKARVLESQREPVSALETDIDPGEAVSLPRYHGINVVEIEPADEYVSSEATRVLVVDDNRDARETLAAVLKIWNYAVAEAEDGPACLAAASACAPDVILLDIGLPHMDGFEVARQLRKLPHLARTRLIAVTAYGTHADKQRAMQAGFDEHFTKPVALDLLRYQLFSRPTAYESKITLN